MFGSIFVAYWRFFTTGEFDRPGHRSFDVHLQSQHMSSNAVTNSVVVVLKTLSLVVGGVVTYYSLKAARRTGQRPLRLFGLGFGVVTVGALLAGVSDQVLQFDRSGAMVIESGFTLAGFLVILYSLTIESDL